MKKDFIVLSDTKGMSGLNAHPQSSTHTHRPKTSLFSQRLKRGASDGASTTGSSFLEPGRRVMSMQSIPDLKHVTLAPPQRLRSPTPQGFPIAQHRSQATDKLHTSENTSLLHKSVPEHQTVTDAVVTEAKAKVVPATMGEEIHNENIAKIARMSEHEIHQMRQDLHSQLSPALITKLSERGKTKDRLRATFQATVTADYQKSGESERGIEILQQAQQLLQQVGCEAVQMDNAGNYDDEHDGSDSTEDDSDSEEPGPQESGAKKASVLDALAAVRSEAELTVVAQKHLNAFEKAKLAWTGLSSPAISHGFSSHGPLQALKDANNRYDLDGRIVTTACTSRPSSLYHHEDMHQMPGYSLREILLLARSSVAMQRSIGLRTISLLLFHNPGAFTYESMNLDVSGSQFSREQNWRKAGNDYIAKIALIWEVLSDGIGEMNQSCRTTFASGLQALHAFLLPKHEESQENSHHPEYDRCGHMVKTHPLLGHLQCAVRMPPSSSISIRAGKSQVHGEDVQRDAEKGKTICAARTLAWSNDQNRQVEVTLLVGDTARKILIGRLVRAVRMYSGARASGKPPVDKDDTQSDSSSQSFHYKHSQSFSDMRMSAYALQCLLRVGLHSYESALDVACVAGLIDMLVEYHVLRLLRTFSETSDDKQGDYECAVLALQMLRTCCCVDKKIALQLRDQGVLAMLKGFLALQNDPEEDQRGQCSPKLITADDCVRPLKALERVQLEVLRLWRSCLSYGLDTAAFVHLHAVLMCGHTGFTLSKPAPSEIVPTSHRRHILLHCAVYRLLDRLSVFITQAPLQYVCASDTGGNEMQDVFHSKEDGNDTDDEQMDAGFVLSVIPNSIQVAHSLLLELTGLLEQDCETIEGMPAAIACHSAIIHFITSFYTTPTGRFSATTRTQLSQETLAELNRSCIVPMCNSQLLGRAVTCFSVAPVYCSPIQRSCYDWLLALLRMISLVADGDPSLCTSLIAPDRVPRELLYGAESVVHLLYEALLRRSNVMSTTHVSFPDECWLSTVESDATRLPCSLDYISSPSFLCLEAIRIVKKFVCFAMEGGNIQNLNAVAYPQLNLGWFSANTFQTVAVGILSEPTAMQEEPMAINLMREVIFSFFVNVSATDCSQSVVSTQNLTPVLSKDALHTLLQYYEHWVCKQSPNACAKHWQLLSPAQTQRLFIVCPQCNDGNSLSSKHNHCTEKSAENSLKLGNIMVNARQVSSALITLPFPKYWLLTPLLNKILLNRGDHAPQATMTDFSNEQVQAIQTNDINSITNKDTSGQELGEFDDDYLSALKYLKNKIGLDRWRKLPAEAKQRMIANREASIKHDREETKFQRQKQKSIQRETGGWHSPEKARALLRTALALLRQLHDRKSLCVMDTAETPSKLPTQRCEFKLWFLLQVPVLHPRVWYQDDTVSQHFDALINLLKAEIDQIWHEDFVQNMSKPNPWLSSSFQSFARQTKEGCTLTLDCQLSTPKADDHSDRSLLEFVGTLTNQYTSSSFGHPIFSKVLRIFLRMEFSAAIRQLMWQELAFGGVIYPFGSPKDLTHNELMALSYPIETSTKLLSLQLDVLVNYGRRGRRDTLFYLLALHHVSHAALPSKVADSASKTKWQWDKRELLRRVVLSCIPQVVCDVLHYDVTEHGGSTNMPPFLPFLPKQQYQTVDITNDTMSNERFECLRQLSNEMDDVKVRVTGIFPSYGLVAEDVGTVTHGAAGS